MMRKLPLIFAAALLAGLLAAGVAQAQVSGRTSAHHPAKRHAKLHGLGAPALLSPADAAHVEQLPTFTWNAVAGASEYEYQVSADPRFHSIVLGTGPGLGTSNTYNLAASLSKPVTDGRYYWRVRALTGKKEPGPWASTRTIVKAWTQAPRLLSPAEGAAITWPSVPLVLSWTPVSGAREYIVKIATDPGLANVVLGTESFPTKTWGSVFAVPSTLASGQYYWAIVPLDSEGHEGAQSAVHSFTWSWPSATTTHLADLTSPGGFQPQFSWDPVLGAAHYEVEVNQSPEFPAGSRWCCNQVTTGTSLTPTELLGNDHSFWWRVRAIDANGDAGVWNLGAGEHGNPGEGFTEAFDETTPSVANLRMIGPREEPLPTDPATNDPIVAWSPVAGASSYEVQLTPYVKGNGCNLAAEKTFLTSSLEWAPQSTLTSNEQYCVSVRARAAQDARGAEVVSTWTQMNGLNKPAFTDEAQPPAGTAGPEGLVTTADDYLLPGEGSVTPRTPLFTWNRVSGAASYRILIARDANFTDIVDQATTTEPTYAPELKGDEPLADQTNAYYWAVIPVNEKGEVFSEPAQDAPHSFTKRSNPPSPVSPAVDSDVETPPTFSWSQAEGALDYTLQVSADPSFGNLLDNVTTDSTSYTSSTTYPAYVPLYWRVRANDTNYHEEGLDWSQTQSFTHTLPVPTPFASNPTIAEAIPAFYVSPVAGAIAYEVHVEQPDGTTKEWTVDSTAFAPTEWDGSGIWRYSVRAEFPTASYLTVAGGFFTPQAVAHTLSPPPNVQGIKSGNRIVISWSPEAYAREYEVDISTSDTFSTTLESKRTEQSSWAPNVNLGLPADRGTIYWRVASIDNRDNLSSWDTGSFVPPKAKCATKKVKRGKHTVRVCVARKKAKKKHH